MNVILLIFLNNEFLNIWVTQICAQRKAIFEVWFALFFNIAASYCPTVCFISLKSNSSQFDRRGKSRLVAQAQIPSCGVGNLPWCPSASTSSHWSSGRLPSNPAVLVSDFLSFTFLVKSVTLVQSACSPPPLWPPSPPIGRVVASDSTSAGSALLQPGWDSWTMDNDVYTYPAS